MDKNPVDPDKAAAAAKRATKAANESAKGIEFELVSFKTGDKTLKINIDVTGETVWATQQQIADLYERDKRTVSEHIQTIISEGELEESSVVRKFRTTASDGKSYEIVHYDLDMILAVGFRVKSPKATQFRKCGHIRRSGHTLSMGTRLMKLGCGTIRALSTNLRPTSDA